MNTKDRQALTELAQRWETEAAWWKNRNPEPTLIDRDAILGELRIANFLASIYTDHARALRGLAGE